MPKDTQAEEYCLEFANTVHWHASAHPDDHLHSYAELLAWAEDANVVAQSLAQQLSEQTARDPAEAAAVFQRAIVLREAIYRVFVARIHSQDGSADDLACINAELADALRHARVVPHDAQFVWAWAENAITLDAVLWPLVRSTAALLTSAELLARVGQCADERGCGWLFLDFSKNHSRRWCDINDCGNRAKQRRHYARAKGDRSTHKREE